MSENFTFFPVFTGRERTAVPTKSPSFIKGVSMIIGTNTGTGVLSITYVSSKAGFSPLLFQLTLVGSLTTVTMPYVAKSTLRTHKHLQLSGLPKRYVDGFDALTILLSICVNSVGTLTAYMTDSGKLLHLLFGISPMLGNVLLFVPAVGMLYLGLKAINRGEKFTGIGMVVMISVLVVATLLKKTTRVGYLLDGNWLYTVPVFNVAAFYFSTQYIVSGVAWGSADKPEKLPRAIMVGMALTFTLLALVPLSVISLSGLDNISDVTTISWGRAFSEWAFFSTNLFALCAMLISYRGLGDSFLTNIFDQFRSGDDKQPVRHLIVLLVVAIPPFVLAYSDIVSFANAFYSVGVPNGVALSIMPIPMLKGARQHGDLTPGQIRPAWMTHLLIQCLTVLLCLCSAVYAIVSAAGYLPAGQ